MAHVEIVAAFAAFAALMLGWFVVPSTTRTAHEPALTLEQVAA